MARWAIRTPRIPEAGPVIGGSGSWAKANDDERGRALAVLADYARGSWTAAEIAGARGWREWHVRAARWLAIVEGLLEKSGKGFRPTAKGRKAVTEWATESA